MNAVEKLRQLVGQVERGGARAAEAWALAERLLGRMPVDAGRVERVCRERDGAGLDALVSELERPAEERSEPPGEAIDEELLKAALKAFNKRLKLSRLADESRLGGRYTSGGRQSRIDAIQPPEDFPPEVWRALAASGKLTYTGQGFYAPAD
jgi:hypothetical protein